MDNQKLYREIMCAVSQSVKKMLQESDDFNEYKELNESFDFNNQKNNIIQFKLPNVGSIFNQYKEKYEIGHKYLEFEAKLFNDDVKIYLCDNTNGTNHKNTKLLTTLDNKEYPLVEDVYLPKDTILYHGSKTGDLEIDYNKTIRYSNYHFLYFTEDYNMAKEWALHKTNIIKKSDIWYIPTEYGETLTKITKNNANKRKIISLKTNKTLKIAKYNGPDSSNIWMWINYHNREQLYDQLKSLGYDGIAELEGGLYDYQNNNNLICDGPSIYIFDLHNVDVIGSNQINENFNINEDLVISQTMREKRPGLNDELIIELKNRLTKGEVKFSFRKLNDRLRRARGTVDLNTILKENPDFGEWDKEYQPLKLKNPYVIRYYDLDKKNWRSCDVSRLLIIIE